MEKKKKLKRAFTEHEVALIGCALHYLHDKLPFQMGDDERGMLESLIDSFEETLVSF